MVFDTTEIASETVQASSSVVNTVTDLATGAADSAATGASAMLDTLDADSVEVISQAAKDAASQIQLDSAKVAELAKEMGLDDPKKPIKYFKAFAKGDPKQIASIAKDFGLENEKTKRMGAKKLYYMLSSMGLEDSSAKEITTGIGKAMVSRVAGADSALQEVFNEQVVTHRMIMKEVQAI